MIDLINDVQFAYGLALAAIGFAIWFYFFCRKEHRLFKNIKRPIGIISTGSDKPMTHEANLLKRVKFFNVTDPYSDNRAVDLLNGKRLVIIGYSASQHFRDAYAAAKQAKIPVIIYAKQGEIQDDWQLIESYSNYTICNTPLRLISDVFAIMSTYPEGE